MHSRGTLPGPKGESWKELYSVKEMQKEAGLPHI